MTETFLSHDEVTMVLRRAGFGDLVDVLSRELPDPVSLRELTAFLGRHGVTHSILTDRFGASP